MMKLYKKIAIVVLITSSTCAFARMDWDELSHEQQKILLPFESSWSSLDNNAKDKLLANTNKWLDMTPVQRMQSRKKLNRFKNLSKKDREKFQKRFEHLKNLSPQERRQVERTKRKFQQLNPKEKARLRKKYNQTPPAHRKKAIQRFNRQQKEKEFISRFDIEKRRPIVEMFKNLEKADRIKFRKSMKNMSPKQRHEQVLLLLSVNPEKRGGYIQGLKQ
ncbi:MAG: DUF3106 domain-containing protein [Proteobacteria bacterium]|nr:DUF3106 domain-containing protein [Pseudomonadota bacterium]